MESGKTMNCRLFGLLFALALLSGGCASVPEDSEIRRDALPFMQGKTEGFFETVAPGAEGKFFLRSFGKATLEIGGGGLSYAELTGEPLYVVGSPELMLEVRFPER